MLIDFESEEINHLKNNSENFKASKEDSFLIGDHASPGNLLALDENELVNSVLEQIRRHLEQTENLKYFNFISHVAGGAGSGLASLISRTLMDEGNYTKQVAHLVFPEAPKDAQLVNTYYALSNSIEFHNATILYDEKIINEVAAINNKTSSYSVVGKFLADFSAPMRSNGRINNHSFLNLSSYIHFPRIHFFAPMLSSNNFKANPSEQQVADNLFNPTNALCEVSFGSPLFAHASILRGSYNVLSMQAALSERVRNTKIKTFRDGLVCTGSKFINLASNYGKCGVAIVQSVTVIEAKLKFKESAKEINYQDNNAVNWSGHTAEELGEHLIQCENLLEDYRQLENPPSVEE